MQTNLTLKSRNEKTGDIPVSTTSANACPLACPLARVVLDDGKSEGNGCYADSGPLALFWRKVTEHKAGVNYDAFLAQVLALPEGQLWRHNQAGDLIGDKVGIDAGALAKLTAANDGKRGFTYTHYDVVSHDENRAAVKAANEAGFTVNLSANNLHHADELAATGAGPVVAVLPREVSGRQTIRTPQGRKVVVCPATYRDDVSCKSCGLCALQREAIVGFPIHGASARKAAIATANA